MPAAAHLWAAACAYMHIYALSVHLHLLNTSVINVRKQWKISSFFPQSTLTFRCHFVFDFGISGYSSIDDYY